MRTAADVSFSGDDLKLDHIFTCGGNRGTVECIWIFAESLGQTFLSEIKKGGTSSPRRLASHTARIDVQTACKKQFIIIFGHSIDWPYVSG